MIEKIFKSKVAKAMEQAKCTELSNLHVAWNDEKKVLAVIEKNPRKGVYEVSAIRVFNVGEKMQKVSETATTAEIESIGSILSAKIHNVSVVTGEGVAVRDRHTCLHMLLTVQEERTKQIQTLPAIQQIPQQITGRMIGYVCEFVSNELQVTENSIQISDSMLLHHTIITGSTGGGKTEIAKRIVSEVNKDRKTVVVLTPEPHLWTTLDHARIVGEEIEESIINVMDFSATSNFEEESSLFLEDIIKNCTNTEQTPNLQLLVAVDEAHQFRQETLEKAVRVLRKYGVGLILISHTYADFNRGIRANIQTHIAMYTNWERDLSFIRQYQEKGGPDYAYLLRHVPEGYGIFRSRDLFRNQPVLCKFLTTGEVFHTVQFKEPQTSEASGRRNSILKFIDKNPASTAEDVQNELSRRKIDCGITTLYKDLDFLVNKGMIRIVKTEERGKKRYASSS